MEPENDDIIRELSAYLSENGGPVSELPCLTHQQEIRLARLIQQENRQAREILVNANLRLVLAMAQRWRTHGVPLETLVEVGTLGLIHAVDKYDHTRGFRFTTYATHWIRQAIGRYALKHGPAEPQ